MTPEQISAHFRGLQEIANKIAGADASEAERKLTQYAADSILQIVESVVLDINRIANALERSN